MGNVRFCSASYGATTKSLGLESMSREQIFRETKIVKALDPKHIMIRESRDSTNNPNSTPCIFGLDVTGSMGFVLEYLVRTAMPQIMERIYGEQIIPDPHLMFMGIGDVLYDRAPLQVSQFEVGAEVIIEQLRQLYLERGGGGNNWESYNLPWYFAESKTVTDCVEKRGKKGFLFTIGDEEVPPALTHEQLQQVFGEGQYSGPKDTHELLNAVQKKYSVFHVVAEEGSHARSYLERVRGVWTQLLGPNVLFMRDHKMLPEIITATLKIATGQSIDHVLAEANQTARNHLRYAFENALRA